MTTTPPAYWTPPSRWGPARIIGLVLGILLLLPGLGLLVGGGVLLWADGPGRNGDGYLYSASDNFSTTGYAITSTSVNLATGADWLPVSSALGTAKIHVASTNGSDVFVGIARVADTTNYIGGVDRSIITDLGSGAPPAIRTGAGAPSTPPGQQNFWVAQAQGSGTQTLTWKPSAGDWTLIVMNADGSARVSVNASVGATVPALTGLAWGLLGAGLFLILIGVLLLVLAIRRPKVARGYTDGPYVMPSGPAPSWTPPTPVDRTTAADARLETPTDQRPPSSPG
jgi:hypothetical protein